MYADLNDARLIALIQTGNHNAFAVLVQRHTDRFFALALRTLQQASEAEDVVQTVFLKLWQNPYAWKSDKQTQFTTLFAHILTPSTVGIRLYEEKTQRIWNRTLDLPTLRATVGTLHHRGAAAMGDVSDDYPK